MYKCGIYKDGMCPVFVTGLCEFPEDTVESMEERNEECPHQAAFVQSFIIGVEEPQKEQVAMYKCTAFEVDCCPAWAEDTHSRGGHNCWFSTTGAHTRNHNCPLIKKAVVASLTMVMVDVD